MKTMKWLLKREFWEHKGMLWWAPLVVAALMMVVAGGSAAYGVSKGKFHLDGHAQATIASMPLETKQELVNHIAAGYMGIALPLFILLAVVVFFYCLGALYDERRDRSVLFWKSLPVSDQQTVLSKVLIAAVVAPLITIGVATVMSLFLVLLGAMIMAAVGVNILGMLLTHPSFYLTPFQLAALLPVYILWALPTIGWLLLVSAWAKSKVFLWAVGVPLMSIVVLKWSQYLFSVDFDPKWFAGHVVARSLTGLVPGVWLPMNEVPKAALTTNGIVDMGGVVHESWMLLGTSQLWVGAILGAAMIFGAMRLRRWKDEG
jgi:ABC-2 type transport system permease protein